MPVLECQIRGGVALSRKGGICPSVQEQFNKLEAAGFRGNPPMSSDTRMILESNRSRHR
jgi:hypothetical protein